VTLVTCPRRAATSVRQAGQRLVARTRARARALPGTGAGTDRGSATGWAIGVMLIGLLLAALVFDGAAAMTSRAQALDIAQQAARAGADQIDLVTLRTTGAVQLNPPAAEAAARDWLAQAGVAGTVTATTDQVTVTVTTTETAVLLAAVGVSTYTLTATGTAEAALT
jgi:hypothetical protein